MEMMQLVPEEAEETAAHWKMVLMKQNLTQTVECLHVNEANDGKGILTVKDGK